MRYTVFSKKARICTVQNQSTNADEFINDEKVLKSIEYANLNCNNLKLINEIIEKAKEQKGLNHRDSAVLLA